jgi:hypothetical protein
MTVNIAGRPSLRERQRARVEAFRTLRAELGAAHGYSRALAQRAPRPPPPAASIAAPWKPVVPVPTRSAPARDPRREDQLSIRAHTGEVGTTVTTFRYHDRKKRTGPLPLRLRPELPLVASGECDRPPRCASLLHGNR